MPRISPSLPVPLLMRSTTPSHQLFWKGSLVTRLQSGPILMMKRKVVLGEMPYWVTRLGPPESTFFPQEIKTRDVLEWKMTFFFGHGNLLVNHFKIVSDQFRGDPYYVELLYNLLFAGLDIFFLTPTQDINKPESSEWPGLLIDE
ncbi:unnamed protein product [Eruca vesicaria subsp. sativa]|uniref:Uncharacterized protein n=1 Tax=Eruca vesicaria subsp. sativa TaxID=29727 RepID=A0ABC8M405_ERUVS|nr:unnamed protein product [Eruca vesicaria subsp. sativa]